MRKLLCTAPLPCPAACLVLASCSTSPSTPAAPQLGDLRQLTHGAENAEATGHRTEKRLVFQSTRAGSEPEGPSCDQQYMMNAEGADQHMVSTGKGVTTLGYFLSNKHILYASTH